MLEWIMAFSYVRDDGSNTILYLISKGSNADEALHNIKKDFFDQKPQPKLISSINDPDPVKINVENIIPDIEDIIPDICLQLKQDQTTLLKIKSYSIGDNKALKSILNEWTKELDYGREDLGM